MTADIDLLDDLLRLAAAGGVEVDVAPDPIAARARFTAAPLVLVGADQANACARARLPRRPRLVLVGREISGATPPMDLAERIGAEHVALLPAAEPWLVDRFATPGATLQPTGRIIAVLGGRGGAGASILASGLAVTGARSGRRTLLVDADPLGGGLDLVLGWEQIEGLRWSALAQAGGRIDVPALVRALPHRGDLVLLSFDRADPDSVPGEAMAACLDAGRRGRDLVVVDLPRYLDDAAVVALQSADRTLLIVPAEIRASAAAARIAALAEPHCADVSVIVRGPAPGNVKADELARNVGLPLAGTLRPEPALCRALEHGEAPAATGRGALAALCRRILEDASGAAEAAA